MTKIKAIRQRDLKDCGVCSMAWIIEYYGGYVSIERLRIDTYTNSQGTTAYHLVEAFKKWGFDAYGVLVKNLDDKKLKFPLIAHLSLDNGLEHFVVVKKVIKNTVYLMDPGIGDKKMTSENFAKLFTGHVIIMHPKEKLVKFNNNLTIGGLFIKILKKEKSLIINIIVTSFLWSLLLIGCSYYLKVGNNYINDNNNILYLILVFGLMTILRILFFYIKSYYQNHLNNHIDVYMYPEFLRHLMFLPLNIIKSRTTGEIITRVTELASIKSLFSDIFVNLVINLLLVISSILVLFNIQKYLLVILILIVIIYGVFGILISKIIYKRVLENLDCETDFNTILVEGINNVESIKNLNVLNIFLDKVENYLSKYILNNYEFNNFINITNLIKDFILEMGIFIINSYGFYEITKGNITILDLFTFDIMISYFIDPFRNIISNLPKYNYIKATFYKLSEFINIEEEKIGNSSELISGDIVFKNVFYSFNNYDYVINNCNFVIKNKEHLLLTGSSGLGKSTLCKLLIREIDINKGCITIGNKNINDVNLCVIRNSISYISQNEELFTGTIKENIVLDRDISDDFFISICKLCEVDKIIDKKRLRYETNISSSGSNLSGGEKQRIILARGLLKNANIIILDEALSEVETKLEERIINNIRSYYKDKTIVYISHRNTTYNFERIIDIGEINEVF